MDDHDRARKKVFSIQGNGLLPWKQEPGRKTLRNYMNNRERFNCVLNFEKPNKFPLMEFMGFWPETVSAWKLKSGGEDLFEHFGLVQHKTVPVNFNFVPPFEKTILEETKNHLIVIDESGCTKKIEKKQDSSSMPHYIDFPIKSRQDFEAVKERLDPNDSQNRYPSDWPELVDEYQNRQYPLGAIIRGPFAFCRDFIHFEQLMMMVYDEPDLIRDMMAFQTDFILILWQKLLSEVELDYIYIGEDMAYKSGPMFSPAMLSELLMPLYTKLTDFFKGFGIGTIILDSDGNIKQILDLYVNTGITCILPLERAAGMDPHTIRKDYPKLKMIGGIDKLKVAQGGQTMIDEMQNAVFAAKDGGYIPCFDHSVPPILSYENYKDYLYKLSEMLNDE